MSVKRNIEVSGDVAVSRHVTSGGNATVRGNVTVGKNLRVEGWLEARNIKGPNKGMFRTQPRLEEVYPRPQEGWWALVGETLPAPLYVAVKGEWVATGEEAGEATLDIDQYNEALAAYGKDLQEVENAVAVNVADIEVIKAKINEICGKVSTVEVDVADAVEKAANAESVSLTARNISEAAMDEAEQAVTTANEAAADARQAKSEASKAMVSATSAKTKAEQAVTAVETLREDVLGLSDSVEALQGALDGKADYDDVEMVEEGLKVLTERVEGMAVLPFDIIAQSATGQPFEGLDDGQVAFISGSGLFARKTPAGPVYPGTYNEMLQGVEPVGARRDCLFRCGNSLYRYDGGQLLRFVDSGEAEADREAVRRDFIGVWDEIDVIKDMLAGVASREVHELLGQLGYDDEAIRQYIYFNLHGYCMVTMDELRLSAWRWTHREELHDVPVLYVLPNFQDEWKNPDFDIDTICRPGSVKYVNYVWVKNGSVTPKWSPYGVMVNEYEVANVDDAGNPLEGEAAVLTSRPSNIYYLWGNIGKINVFPPVSYYTHIFSTRQDEVALGGGLFYNQVIDWNDPNLSLDKVVKLLSRPFENCTLKNFKIGAWDCSESYSGISGCTVKDSHIGLDFKGVDIGNDGLPHVDNSTVELINLHSGYVTPSGFRYNSGARDSVSVITGAGIEGFDVFDLISLNGAATVCDMPALSYIPFSSCESETIGGEEVHYFRDWRGDVYYTRFFFRNVGGNIGGPHSSNPFWAYQWFNVTTDGNEIARRNIELFVECGQTWADRVALGYSSNDVYISQKVMDRLTPEQKAVFTSKGYTLIALRF